MDLSNKKRILLIPHTACFIPFKPRRALIEKPCIIERMTENERLCVLMFDEISIRPHLQWRSIFGRVDCFPEMNGM